MKKTLLLGTALSAALIASSAMAADTDFHAFSKLSGPVTSMQNSELAAIEGGDKGKGKGKGKGKVARGIIIAQLATATNTSTIGDVTQVNFCPGSKNTCANVVSVEQTIDQTQTIK